MLWQFCAIRQSVQVPVSSGKSIFLWQKKDFFAKVDFVGKAHPAAAHCTRPTELYKNSHYPFAGVFSWRTFGACLKSPRAVYAFEAKRLLGQALGRGTMETRITLPSLDQQNPGSFPATQAGLVAEKPQHTAK